MYLGIEIGGTKLQLGVGTGDDDRLVAMERGAVQPRLGAEGILRQIEQQGRALIKTHSPRGIGVGFGGPVDPKEGRVVKSHHVEGWTDFPLARWCAETFGLPTVVGNDSDLAGLAEARFGAGQGHKVVFYTNCGSGIGGALVIEGQLYRGGHGMAVEPGHLRPGLQSERPDQTIEALASGWGITASVQSRLAGAISHPMGTVPHADPETIRQCLIEREDAEERDAADLLDRCEGKVETLNTKTLAEAAREGNRLAREAFDRAAKAFGWAIAQVITLLAPNVVVLGGGVSLAGEKIFLAPLRRHVRTYVFPPLVDSCEIVPARLGEEVVVHGALALARGGGKRVFIPT